MKPQRTTWKYTERKGENKQQLCNVHRNVFFPSKNTIITEKPCATCLCAWQTKLSKMDSVWCDRDPQKRLIQTLLLQIIIKCTVVFHFLLRGYFGQYAPKSSFSRRVFSITETYFQHVARWENSFHKNWLPWSDVVFAREKRWSVL